MSVGVKFTRLGFEPAIRTLALQVELDGFGGSVQETTLFEFHHLISAIADVKGIVKSFAPMHLAMVIGDELANMRRQQRLRSLPAGHLDMRPALHHPLPIIRCAFPPDTGLRLIIRGGIAHREIRVARDAHD